MEVSEIRKRYFNNDPEVLKRGIEYLTEKTTLERERSNRAEARASVTLGISGILVGFVTHFSQLLVPLGHSGWLLLAALFVGSLAFLVEASLYSLCTIWPTKSYELSPELAFDIQLLPSLEGIREELVWRTWEYYALLDVGNLRMFYLHRAQRNAFAAVIAFALLGTAWFAVSPLGLQIGFVGEIVVAGIVASAFFSLDFVAERFGDLWKFSK